MSDQHLAPKEEKQKLPWQKYPKNWTQKIAQSVNSAQYRQLKDFIHKPYRKIDHATNKCYYFPTYCIFKIKNITEFNFDSLSARINGVLIIKIKVNYKDQQTVIKQKSKLYQKDDAIVMTELQKLFAFDYQNDFKELINKENAQDSQLIEQMRLIKDKKKKKVQQLKDQKKDQQLKDQSKQNQKKDQTQESKHLYVQFNRDNPIRLPSKRIFQGQIKKQCVLSQKEAYIMWTIRKQFTISLDPGDFWSDLIAPFSRLNFKLSLSFEDVILKIKKLDQNSQFSKNEQTIKFKFNCMKRVDIRDEIRPDQEQKKVFQQLSFTDDGSLGEYDLAEKFLEVRCQKLKSSESQEDQNQYKSFKMVIFTIPFYKYPIMDSLTIFIPLVLITILTMFTFVQGPDYNDKISNIATLMIVYVGLVPVISDSLPPTTSLTLIDLVVYMQLVINILCLVRGYTIKDYNAQNFDNYKVWHDPLFIISVLIALITGCILIGLLVYYCIMKKYYYNLEQADIDEGEKQLNYWVSYHMYKEARNLKTSSDKRQKQKKDKKNEGQVKK